MSENDTFAKRIETLLKYYKLSPAEFANKIKINRTTLSHLNSGRNKPSLDVISKITKYCPEVSYDWLLDGKGTFPAEKKAKTPNFTTENNAKKTEEKSEPKNKAVKQIIIFYTDGSFEIYK